MPPTCGGDFGTTAAAQRVETFVSSVNQFATSAVELNNALLNGCRDMATALEISPAEIAAASASANPTQALCERASRQLRDELTTVRASANLRTELVAVPPVCEVSVDAYARCAGECDASFTPGSADIQCEGGELRGVCSASCTGRCAVDVSGTCNGTCEGTCSAYDAQGNCTGSCQGRCVTQASGTCGGECRGGCSVAFTEPRCTGHVRPPRVQADCRAACDARFDAQATCRPGAVTLRIDGSVASDLQDRVRRVQAALGGGFRTVVGLRARLERAARSGADMARAASELPNAVAQLSAGAAACAVAASQVAASAVASVNVSVQVSVSVSASASVQ